MGIGYSIESLQVKKKTIEQTMGDIVLLLSSRKKRVLSVDRFMILHLKWLLPSKFFILKHNVHGMKFKYSINHLFTYYLDRQGHYYASFTLNIVVLYPFDY